MRRTSVILLMLVMMVGTHLLSDVFITELADPDNAAGARFVELYNSGAAAVDLSTGYDLQRWTNGNAAPQSAVELNGTIPAGGFYIVCANQTTFTSTFGFAADQNIGGGGPADSNGDDQIALRDPSDVIIDMFGVPGEDGSGTNHEFEDGRAERKATVTTGNATYTFAEWNIWNDTGAAGTTNAPQNAPEDFDPGAWIGASTGSNTTIQFSPGSTTVSEGVGTYDLTITIINEDATNATTCDVVLTVGDAADVNNYTTQGVTFPAGINANQTVTVTVTDDSSYEGDEILTFSIQNVAGGNSATVGSIVDFNLTIEDNDPATTIIPYVEPFDSDLGDCYTYSVSGATKEWYQTGGYAKMNGYNSGDTEEDWLILPGINLDNYSNEIMSFDSWYKYGTDDANNYIKLLYSANYAGLGDPTGSSWTELSFAHPGAAETWTGSGNIDLSAISGTSVWIAFKYHYESGNYRTWEIDNISIAEVANLAPEISNITQTPASNIGTSTTVSISADVTDTDGTISSVELHWGLSSGSLGTTISMSNGGSGDTYTTSTDIPAQSEGTTVYYEVYAVDDGSASTTSDETSYFVTDATAPGVGDLLITEVVGDGAGGGSDDGFMEIYNDSDHTISLTNVQARYYNSNPGNPTQTVDLSGTIAPDAYVIVTQNETNFNATYSPITADFSGSNFYFNGGDDGVDIYHTSNGVLDQFNEVGSGTSPWDWAQNVFERTSTGSGAIYTNWTEITTGIGTPGAANDHALPVTLTSFTAVPMNNQFVNISWTTQSESGMQRYNLYRSENGITSLINTQQAVNLTTTYTYSFDDMEVAVGHTYEYVLEGVEIDGTSSILGSVLATLEEGATPQLPQATLLSGNYPNPFNPVTEICFSVKENETATLTIFDAKGRTVSTERYSNGTHNVEWDATAYGSGIYFYKLSSPTYSEVKKMIMLK